MIARPNATGKILQLDYDAILALPGTACTYCLTDQQVMMILGFADYWGWRTRWISEAGEVDQDVIDELRDNLVSTLMGCFENGGGNDTEPPPGWTPQDDIPPGNPRTEATTGARRCAAAANAVAVFRQTYKELDRYLSITGNEAIDVAIGVTAIIAVLLLAPYTWMFAVPIIGAMIAASVTVDFADWTTEVQETLTCIFYIHATDDGQGNVTFDYDAIRADVQAESGVAWTVIDYILQIVGTAGLNRAGSTTSVQDAVCDCADAWCYTFDFALSDGGWTVEPFGTEPSAGNYASGRWNGEGFFWTVANNDLIGKLSVALEMPADANVTQISWTYNKINGTYAPGTNQDVVSVNGANVYIVNSPSVAGDGIDRSIAVDGDWDVLTGQEIKLTFGFCRDISSPYVTTGRYWLLSVTLSGNGANPFGADNC